MWLHYRASPTITIAVPTVHIPAVASRTITASTITRRAVTKRTVATVAALALAAVFFSISTTVAASTAVMMVMRTAEAAEIARIGR